VPAEELPRDVRITRIVRFDLVSRRDKLVGKNSRLGEHGREARDPMIRVFTSAGLEGLGRCGANQETCAGLLGRDPFAYFRPEESGFVSPLRAETMVFWDLLGKVREQPVYQLLGGGGPARVPTYDGSIYFADLLPAYQDRWRERFREEIDMGLAYGHRAFKIKIGRGAKWMPAEEGFARDKEVVQLIRDHAGPEVTLAVDANNGYDLARTKRFLSELPGIDVEFIEEMFEENVEQYLDLKAFLAEQGMQVLIADGETQGALEPLLPFMEARAIDLYQLDTNRFGMEGIRREAAEAAKHGLAVVPHNWASLIGFYTTLQLGRGLPNLRWAENDLSANEILLADGYRIQDGLASVPEAPGFGLAVHEANFAAQVKPVFDIWA
jgi:L-alanine-DL-glutamate epimerase-like enolase superfamily enzyme